jgi:miniconductance mechanosensitive channel
MQMISTEYFQEGTDLVKTTIIDRFAAWLVHIGVPQNIAMLVEVAILIGIVVLLSVIANFIAKKIILSVIKTLVRKSKTDWDDILLEHKVFDRLSHFAPALIIYMSAATVLSDFPSWMHFIQKCSYLYMIIITLVVLVSFINGVHGIYKTTPAAKNRSIKGYIQVVKILIYLVGAIVIMATILGKSPVFMLSGLGAFTAILMLIFQDAIKGLVGGIQLSATGMIKLGDYITVPKQGVDGTVIEISLSSVKIQNSDMTFCSIPTSTLVNETFNNWRGMEESGGRRIKRAVHIDQNSIKFCTEEMLQKFEKIQLVNSYIKTKKEETAKYNQQNKVDNSCLINGKRLTNLGIFRKYLEEYIRNHQNMNPEMTYVVRCLDPGPNGLPLEIWVFCRQKNFSGFESVQSDLFEHVLTSIHAFDLRLFQNPSGEDIRPLVHQ